MARRGRIGDGSSRGPRAGRNTSGGGGGGPLRPSLRAWVGLLVLGGLLGLARPASARVEVSAVVGSPFGIGRITAPLTGADVGPTRDAYAFSVTDPEGRVRYPVFTAPVLGRLLSGLFGGGQGGPVHTTAYFLFVGEAPLTVTLHTPAPQTFTVVPAVLDPRRRDRLRDEWLTAYLREASQRVAAGDYPPDAEAYLSAMLSRRMGAGPVLPVPPPEADPGELIRTVDLLFGTDRVRLEMIADQFLRPAAPEAATLPPPTPLPWRPILVPPLPADVPVEPIASVVPHDCFYLRFGTFANYLWLDRLAKEYGGDVARLATLRGQALPASGGPQAQLALTQDDLAEVFGPSVISDVAVVGYDLFLEEGPAVGVIFEAKNALLGQNFGKQRRATFEAAKADGATLEDVTVAGREVSFLHTPDHRVRSFYAVRGKYHLHTNCRALVEAFLTVGTAAPSAAIPLAATDEFRHARARMPLTRDDTIFAYLSTAFLQRLVDHPTQIELRRRTASLMEIRVLKLARLAAAAEGLPAADVPSLIAAGLLPASFGARSDGSALAEVVPGMLGDSVRGYPGTFLPIPDVPPTAITRAETADAARRAGYVRSAWPEMDPMMVGLKRYALDETQTLERIVLDGDVSPLREEKWAFLLSLLGPPTTRQVPPVPGELIHVEAAVRGGLLSPGVPEHTLTLGILDAPRATPAEPRGLLGWLAALQATPGYLAAWPAPGFLDRLTLGLAGPPDPAGYTPMMFSLTRWQGNGFSVLSFQPPVLDHAAANLRPVPAERPAQVRIAVGDLAGSNLAGWVEALYQQRARQTTVGNLRMMHLMSEQFRLDRPTARATVEDVLGTRLVDPLEGDYEPATVEGLTQWQSTRLPGGVEVLPAPEITVERLPADESPIEALKPGAPPLPPPVEGVPAADPVPGEPLPLPGAPAIAPPPGGPAVVTTTVPLLAWLRAFSAELTHVDGEIVVHAEVTISRAPRREPTLVLPDSLLSESLPSWKDFVPRGLPGFGGNKPEKATEDE